MRIVLLGMNSPRTGKAFDVVGGTGKRLLLLLGQDCLDQFEKTNVLMGRSWDRMTARRAGRRLLPKLAGAVVVVLGNEAWRALALPRETTWLGSCREHGATFYKVPHLSGRCRYYNDRKYLTKVTQLMRKVAGMT